MKSSTTNRVLFLDFDGVISILDSPEDPFTAAAVERLKEIIRQSGCDVVITSSWREMQDLASLRRMLAGYGVPSEKVIGVTPVLKVRERGLEIAAWLKKNPAYTCFVILDDDNDMAHLKARLVQTDPAEGLNDAAMRKVLSLFMC